MIEKTENGGLWPSLYDPLRAFAGRVADWLSPASEASGSEAAYAIAMELPGVGEDDIEITVDDGVVTVRGEKKTETTRKGDTWFFSERQYGAFRRSFRLPDDADSAHVDAQMKDGVLNITVPKLPAEAPSTARKVTIRKS